MKENHHYLMKTFQQFNEDIAKRRAELKQRSDDNMKSFYSKATAHRKSADEARQRKQERDSEKEELKREIKQELASEVYDPEVMGSSQIRKTGEGGRIGAERKKTEPEKRRMKAIGGGKTAPAKDYKPRKDIGQQKQRSEIEQQPENERGSAEVKQSYADKVKAERRAAAQARIAAKKGGSAAPEKKKTPTASELLAKKKKKEVAPTYKPGAGKPQKDYTRKERQQLIRKGESEVIKMMKDTESKKQGIPASKVKLQKFKRTYG